jgi:hypothetical protein
MIFTIEKMLHEAQKFCIKMTKENHEELFGITDGKAIGTYVEHRFKDMLSRKYNVTIGNSAKGIDLPDLQINTDIKVTSFVQPQSSCPFKSARQKIFGLGYNILVFVYRKTDKPEKCELYFTNCAFVSEERTGDYTTTKRLVEMLHDGANKDDIIGFLSDKNIPGDDITYNELSEEILRNPPKLGYLTISNALQWRLQYGRVLGLNNNVHGVRNYVQ